MKKILTLLTAILLMASMAMQAQLLSEAGDIPEAGNLLNTNSEIKDMAGRRNGPNMTVDGIIYNSNCYCKVQYVGDNKFDIWFKTNSNYITVFYIKNVPMASATNINGSHNFSKYSNSDTNTTTWFYTTSNTSAKKGNPYGYISFIYTGRTSSDGDPMYKIYIYCTACAGQLNYQNQYGNYGFDGEMGVYAVDENGNAMALDNNVYEEVNVPGNTTRTTGSYLAWEGENESFRCHFETNGNESSQCNTTFFNTIDWSSTWMKRLPDGSQSMPNNGYVKEEDSNGFHFLDTYFSYSNAVRHTTMQYPNYQAVNTSYSAEFDWNDVTLIKKNNNTITLTAVDATSQKKAVIDFVVNGEINNANPVIPAGSYTIGTSGDAGTVIASKGINRDLSINSSYAGSTTALTAANCASNPLWCFRTGTVTVGEDQSVTVVANQSYRGSPVDITINGPITSGTQYTITVQTATPDYCMVSGGGTYFEGEEITISSASKNEHLYIFDQFMLEGEDVDMTEPSFNITVTGNATYTAYYRLANAGNITATAAHGTVSGTGSYAGGTEVTLEVTADDGYVFTGWDDDDDGVADNTDNQRTVYVDGDREYTALFVEGAQIDIPYAVLIDHSSWFNATGESGAYRVVFETSQALAYGDYPASNMDWDNTHLYENGVEIPLNHTITATITKDEYQLHKWVRIDALFIGTNGKQYSVDMTASYAITTNGWDESEEDFVGVAIPDCDFGTSSSTTCSSEGTLWLSAGVEIGDNKYFIDLQFKVAGSSIPTGVYPINHSFENGTAIPLNSITTKNNYPSWNFGCYVEMDTPSSYYWWWIHNGTITVTNTDGDYYVEVEGRNSYGKRVSFTMGTPPVNNHTVSITAPSNGTITVSYNDGADQSFTSGSRDIAENTVLTITAEGATGYHFDGWTNDGAASVTVNGDKTIGATFAANAYTVTFNKNNESATGSMDNQAFTYGTAQNLSDNGFTAPTGMHFTGWATEENGAVVYTNKEEVSNLTATQNGKVELFAKWADNTYTVVFNKNNEDATGTMANQAFTYGTAQNLTPNGFTSPDPELYDFAGWATEENGKVVYTNGEEVTNLTAVHEGTVTLYAKWIEAFALIDDKDAGNSYYDETLAGKVGQTLSVHYIREFPKKQWAAFSLPFGYSYQKKGNNTFKDQVYYLISAEYEIEGGKAYLTLNCMPNTLGIVANKPYILIPNETIVNPVFNNVKMKAQALNYYSVPCTNIGVDNPVETVEFRNTLTRMQFTNNDHRQIYLVGSKLRYPNDGTHIRAFRGYFYMQEGTIHHIQPRLRNVETGEIIEAEEETNTTVETKKYIENGILVIERNGIKYDAQGHVIK